MYVRTLFEHMCKKCNIQKKVKKIKRNPVKKHSYNLKKKKIILVFFGKGGKNKKY